MATLGKIEEFNKSREDWPQYVERLSYFFLANDIKDAEKQRAVLLAAIGPATYKTLRSLISPRKPGELSYDDLVKTLADHISPAPSEIVQRFRFNSQSRKTGESVATFVAELRAIAECCNFGDTLEVMLRDRVVCGINNAAIQKQLLAEQRLTFKQALDISQGLEAAAHNVKELKTPSATQEVEGVCQIVPKTIQCFRCGKPGHYAAKCKVPKSVVCRKCGKAGHMQKACKSGRHPSSGRRQLSSVLSRASTVRHVEEEQESTPEENVPIWHVSSNRKTPPYKVTLEVDGCQVEMEIDTGSSVSLVSQ